jgi:site-specific recombinase XerD
MLHNNITNFLQYCKNSNFSERSIEALSFRLNEFQQFLKSLTLSTIKDIRYLHLAQFVADFKKPSAHVKKARVWALHQFFHYLKLQHLIDDNIAQQLPYPKIEKTVPQFLTDDEFQRLLSYFAQQATDLKGLRNLLLIMLLGFLGLRTNAIVSLNINDVDLIESRLWIQEKGYGGQHKKDIVLPQVVCQLLAEYIPQLQQHLGDVPLDRDNCPLFISKRRQRLARRSLQSIFYNVAPKLNIEKKLHPHLFRHTAATQLNQLAGLQITQLVLGHQSQYHTHHYAQLNPTIYAEHMKNHPYMKFDL